MGMSDFYGPGDDAHSIATLERAIELGVTFWDTADMYGMGANETLIGPVVRRHRDRITLATKFGVKRGPTGTFDGVDGRPEYVREACDRSLARLGVDHIDLYYQHRVDLSVPIEETVGAMAELVAAGKVRHLGLSEASAATIRRAAAIHPIAAVQMEYSLWTRDAEAEVLPACRELGIGFVAYSPLGRGFLAGGFSPAALAAGDIRHALPRFTGENLDRNRAIVERVHAVATAIGATPAQVALRWLLDRGDDVVAIPGTRRPDRLAENARAADVRLPAADAAALTDGLPAAAGERYMESAMGSLNG
jgi:aryl-alcohol dehydrogenase-like predicted oxidoreductase